MKNFKIISLEEKNKKVFLSKDYNYLFDKETGLFARWGKIIEEDPEYSPYGPEILDLECTTICNNNCHYCYKDNSSIGKNMSFDTFKKILKKVNQNQQLTQIAFGLDSTGEANPDFWKMCSYSKRKGIIANGTVANISWETAEKIAYSFGACAISYHGDKDICYGSVKKLTDHNLKQTNMHVVIYKENIKETLSIIDDIVSDKRLSKLNAIVFLSLKQKGRACNNNLNVLSQEEFEIIVQYAIDKKINFGMDSCSSTKFLKFISKHKEYKSMEQFVEPCESFGLFSSYIDVNGNYYPCSFAEGKDHWTRGENVLETKDFIKEIWNGKKLSKDRVSSLENCRECLLYKI